MFLPSRRCSMVFDRSDSGEIYNIDTDPSATLSKDLLLSIGSSKPFIVAASVIPDFSRLSTWSFIKDCSGEITTVSPFVFRPAISAGTWKVSDLPPPVGKTASNDLFPMAASTAFSCKGSLLYLRKVVNPKKSLSPECAFSASSQ